MDAYVRWFESEGEKGGARAGDAAADGPVRPPGGHRVPRRALAGAGDRGTDRAARRAERGATQHRAARLADAKLVTVNRDAGGALVSLDAHPLLREYFAKDLRENRPEAWKAAHRRLYEHLTTTTQDKPEPTLDDLQPLYQAVAHGCHAGLQQEACEEVYHDRILRGPSNGHYSIHKLGAFGADLGAVACFFDQPWHDVSRNLAPRAQSWLLNQAAYLLRGLGRLPDAMEPMRAALNIALEQGNWIWAAVRASNLSELELILGDVAAAVPEGGRAVFYADRTGNAFQSTGNRSTYADAVHQAGRRAEAQALFAEAEALQAGRQPQFPLLYALQGFRYCELLLGDAERASWVRLLGVDGQRSPALERALESCCAVSNRASRTTEWMESDPDAPVLTVAVEHLTLARAATYHAILSGDSPVNEPLKTAIHFLHRASDQGHVPSGLLTRALFRATTGDFAGAREDLDEAFEIAERGPMRLHLADIHLHRARLFGLIANRPSPYPWVSPRDDLDTARKLIETCGYGRRREELEDAEAAWERVYGTTAPAGSPPA